MTPWAMEPVGHEKTGGRQELRWKRPASFSASVPSCRVSPSAPHPIMSWGCSSFSRTTIKYGYSMDV